jgi:hypothetical protein
MRSNAARTLARAPRERPAARVYRTPVLAATHETLSASDHSAQLRKAVIASTIGTAIEWYDFFLYGTAAGLIFGNPFSFLPRSIILGTVKSIHLELLSIVTDSDVRASALSARLPPRPLNRCCEFEIPAESVSKLHLPRCPALSFKYGR